MEKNKIHIYLYNALIVLCLLGGAVYVVSQFMHFGGGEFTDNARVRQNVVSQSSRVQGFIREVRFADFQQVKKGDTLAIIEDAEFRLRLAQAETDLIRAEHGSQGTASSIVTTKTSMTVTEAGIESARVQMENAMREDTRFKKLLSQDAVTLLDINNTVPKDMYEEDIKGKFDYTLQDTFMGFHCGNTASNKLSFCEMKYQKIMARSLPIEVTNGTLEGDIAPGDITFFRLQSTSDAKLRAYIAQGEVLPVATRSFGSIGIFAIPEMGRFYRHVLIEKNFPHHGAVAFGNYGKALYEVFKYIGVPVEEIGYNQPAGVRYPTENPFK